MKEALPYLIVFGGLGAGAYLLAVIAAKLAPVAKDLLHDPPVERQSRRAETEAQRLAAENDAVLLRLVEAKRARRPQAPPQTVFVMPTEPEPPRPVRVVTPLALPEASDGS